MNDSSHKLDFLKKRVKIFDDKGNLIGTEMKTKGNLFYHDPNVETCFFVRVEDVWMWHKRLCHVNFENMVKISRKKRVRGLPNLQTNENAICKECQLVKLKNSIFSRKAHTSNDMLELMHTDLCRPIIIESYYGDRYFILFIDYYSRMISIMFTKVESHVFDMFKWYKARIEKEIGKSLKC